MYTTINLKYNMLKAIVTLPILVFMHLTMLLNELSYDLVYVSCCWWVVHVVDG